MEAAYAATKEAVPVIQATLRKALHRWDDEAEPSGLPPALEQRADGAHDRAKALLTRLLV